MLLFFLIDLCWYSVPSLFIEQGSEIYQKVSYLVLFKTYLWLRYNLFFLFLLSSFFFFSFFDVWIQLGSAHLGLGLSFIGTDPHHECRGAASLLLQWGLEHCKKDEVPAYLESTIDAGSLYQKHGFEAAETLSILLDSTAKDIAPVIYREICFVFRPSVMSHISEQSIRPAS